MFHHRLHFGAVRPDVPQINRLTVSARTERLGVEIDIDPARDGKGHHQRRGHEEVGLDVGVDARLEVAVAGQYRCRDRVVGDDGLFQLGVQRAGIADAGGAAVGREAETELRRVGSSSPALVR